MAALAPEPDFRALSRQPPPDPDIQATLSDFLTYTEHFPSHITRALALIEDRRARSEQKVKSIHNKTTAYSLLPSLGKDERPDPVELRKNISYALEEAEKASRMAFEEAIRLGETCQRESKRLDFVVEKLKAQPMPPSRDPTPEAQLLTSPNLRRERGVAPRVDDGRSQRTSRHLDDQAATKLRGRKIMVPGEVLPPPDPNAPPESISDWSSPPPSPPRRDSPSADRTASPRARARTPKFNRSDRGRDRDRDRHRDRKTPKPRTPRQPGQPGTNAHSAVAGISTSNALLALTAPPPDAVKGSRWLPWMKLTEWEMAKLRKRMKKNAIWVPSQTMVRRELKNLGRGINGKEAAKAAAEESGEPFVDEHSEADPTKLIVNGDEDAAATMAPGPQIYAEDEDADAELVNRGMRLNEAKKLKRQRMMEEQALQAQLAREQGVDAPADGKAAASSSDGQRKRKRETSPMGDTPAGDDAPSSPDLKAAGSKKLKISAPALSALTTSKMTPTPASLTVRARRAATPQETKRPVLILKAGKAVSEEPPNRRSTLRRGSNVSLPNGSSLAQPPPGAEATVRRRKRPAPGILTSNHDDDGGAKVGVSKRKAAPKKKTSLSKPLGSGTDGLGQGLAADQLEEYVDPDEPRYCVCGDVSWGTMIACDNDDCEKEWFHLSCVGLTELPPRRTKWYCPDCRKRLKLGQASNGLMGKAQGR